MVTFPRSFVSDMQDHFRQVEKLLTEIRDSTVVAPRRSDKEDIDPVIVKVVTVTTAGTSVQGPDVKVPTGFSCVIRQRRHTGTPTGYVAFSRNSVNNSRERIELRDNETVSVRVGNLKDIWVDGTSLPTTGGLNFELIVER